MARSNELIFFNYLTRTVDGYFHHKLLQTNKGRFVPTIWYILSMKSGIQTEPDGLQQRRP